MSQASARRHRWKLSQRASEGDSAQKSWARERFLWCLPWAWKLGWWAGTLVEEEWEEGRELHSARGSTVAESVPGKAML